jgi:peroxiredoxin
MTERTRTYALAASIGVVVAVGVVLAGFWLGGAFEPSNRTDGSFVLDEPGVFQQPADEINEDSSGESLPDVALVDVDGAERRLSEFRGEPLVVNLWFSTCAPCKRELADFAEVHAELGDEVRFVGVDPFDTVEAMERFAAERGVMYDLWRDDEFALTNELEIVGYPVTLFVSPEGRILRQTGEIDADELRRLIEELF